MSAVRWLGVVPFIAMLAGLAFFNQATPFVLGMPLLLAWMVGCVILTSAIMGVIYLCDPANRSGADR
jgi:hypothetical protein